MSNHPLLIEPVELAGLGDDPRLRLFDETVLFSTEEGARDHYVEGHEPRAGFLDHAVLSAPTHHGPAPGTLD